METRIPRDNLHLDLRPIDGFNKWLNFIMSCRELGKTDVFWWKKIYCNWVKDGKAWGYLVRQSVEITEQMIDDIKDNIINKWAIDSVDFQYTKGSFKDGMCDVKINGKLFFRIVSLSLPLRRLKLAKIPNIGGIFMDEYIIDPRTEEKYQKNEYFKIKELYTTWRREYTGKGFLKIYFSANPYSLFNPIFVGLNIDVNKLRKDEYIKTSNGYKLHQHILVGDEYAIQWGVLHPELREKLLEANPLYKFDEDYNQYALEGTAVNDRNIKIGKLPKNFYLQFVLRIDNKIIGIFRNNYVDDLKDDFFCCYLDSVSARRTSYCFDFEQMMERTILVSMDERMMLQRFKEAFRKRAVTYSDVSVYYYLEEIYKSI
ncbi:MAG: phage DNA encapsidation protein [Methanobrevibacter sp.]|nr:phage DNA encapsidation protein [Methanobrevibacter sp.]